MPGSNGARIASRGFAACSPSRCGTATAKRCSSRATGSASSRCTTRCCRAACCVFGSELKSLVAHPEFRRDLDPFAIEEYFALGYVPEPRTIYTGARKLPPAHTLTIRRGQPLPEPREYWDVRFTLDNPIGERDARSGAGRPPARIGPVADDRRGAARRVSLRRRGLERRRRDDGRRQRGARSTPARSPSAIRRSTNRGSPGRSPTGTTRGTSSTPSKATIST